MRVLLKWWGINRTLTPGCRRTATHGWIARRTCECIGIVEISHNRRHRYLTAWLTTTGPARVRCDGLGRGDFAGLLRSARPRPSRRDHPRFGGSAHLNRKCRRPCLSPSGSLRGPVHVVAWATDALDVVRRQEWNEAAGWRGPSSAPQLPTRFSAGLRGQQSRRCERRRRRGGGRSGRGDRSRAPSRRPARRRVQAGRRLRPKSR